jgi:putative acetyltransferase
LICAVTAETHIRPERPDDHVAIGVVIRAAFLGKSYAAGDEAELVDALRKRNALAVSFVAECNGTIIGQLAMSRAVASDGASGWYALGPVAVLPERQGRGIGARLVRAGLQAIRRLGANGCILTGDPAYYRRFGFVVSPANAPPGEPAEFFMIKAFGDRIPTGPIHFDEAFHAA